ncbi:unnamed protein product [Didymodactylos carnosus]|uniref:Uncharacterized protein n=1 Tax=Didymodactylos carnosus TaxID=1234261 RepID=A0A815H243_9BILA|nr:unnamed protein product [Didymodactylos carnosus]CAF4210315.1 unnamed protein product [Didymodactylos carnosus]
MSDEEGYGSLPLMSPEMAVEPLTATTDKLAESTWTAKANCQHLHDNLTQHESAAIRLCTMDTVFEHLHKILRSRVRAKSKGETAEFDTFLNLLEFNELNSAVSPLAKSLTPWLPYLKLLLTALCKLLPVKKTVWRGTSLDLSTLYK